MITAGSFALGLLALQGLTVQTTTPRALCPTTVAVEEQLTERLQVLGTTGHDWTLELENGHAFGPPAQDFVIVHLFDDHRTLRLEQRIDVTGADCGLRARSVALVVAEFLENSADEAPQPHPETPALSPAGPEPSTEAPTPRSEDRPAPPPVPSPPAPNASGPAFSVGAAAALVDNQWGGALRLGFRPRPSLELSLLGAFTSARHETIGDGSATLHALPIRLGVSPVLQLGPFSGWLGADAFFSYEWAKTQGLERNRSNDRPVFGFGAQAGLRGAVLGPLQAFGLATADYVLPLAGSRFEIDGREVLQPGPVRWAFVLGLEIDVLGRR